MQVREPRSARVRGCFRQHFGGFGEHFAGGGDGGNVVGLGGGFVSVGVDAAGVSAAARGFDYHFGGRLEDWRALAELGARQGVDAVGG